MEDSELEDAFYFLRYGYRPPKFSGKTNLNKFKSWKKKVKRWKVQKRIAEESLTSENFHIMVEKKGKMKILVGKKDLNNFWKKFHTDKDTGGHQG